MLNVLKTTNLLTSKTQKNISTSPLFPGKSMVRPPFFPGSPSKFSIFPGAISHLSHFSRWNLPGKPGEISAVPGVHRRTSSTSSVRAPTSSASMMLAAWEVLPEASPVLNSVVAFLGPWDHGTMGISYIDWIIPMLSMGYEMGFIIITNQFSSHTSHKKTDD